MAAAIITQPFPDTALTVTITPANASASRFFIPFYRYYVAHSTGKTPVFCFFDENPGVFAVSVAGKKGDKKSARRGGYGDGRIFSTPAAFARFIAALTRGGP